MQFDIHCRLMTSLKRQTQRIKTITRTFRLDEQMAKMLEEEAAKEKITVNSLVSRMLWNYKKRCQYCLHYNLMLVEPSIFKRLVDSVSDEALSEFGASLGPSVVRENLARLGMTMNRQSVEYVLIESLGQWTKWYDADVNETSEGRVYYLHHVLGKKWSVFLKSFLQQAMLKLLNLEVQIEMMENSITFTLPEPKRMFKPL